MPCRSPRYYEAKAIDNKCSSGKSFTSFIVTSPEITGHWTLEQYAGRSYSSVMSSPLNKDCGLLLVGGGKMNRRVLPETPFLEYSQWPSWQQNQKSMAKELHLPLLWTSQPHMITLQTLFPLSWKPPQLIRILGALNKISKIISELQNWTYVCLSHQNAVVGIQRENRLKFHGDWKSGEKRQKILQCPRRGQIPRKSMAYPLVRGEIPNQQTLTYNTFPYNTFGNENKSTPKWEKVLKMGTKKN